MTLPHPSEPNCRICVLKEAQAEDFTPFDESTEVAHIGQSAIFLVHQDRNEILVAPSEHVARITSLSHPAMAQFLASLRRVVMALQGSGDGELETEEMPGAHGHVVVRLIPTVENAPQLAEFDPRLTALLRDS
jgi:hypothetical protein